MLQHRNPPNQKTRILQFRFKLNQKSLFEFVRRDAEESEFFDLADFGGVAF